LSDDGITSLGSGVISKVIPHKKCGRDRFGYAVGFFTLRHFAKAGRSVANRLANPGVNKKAG
jgi:hypothetical protein